MKLRNYLCLFIFTLLSWSYLFATDLKVRITAQGSPLGYSYISVNGEVKATADSMGVAMLPVATLKVGDKIAASFVGFNGAEVTFDSKAEQSKELVINLTNDFTLDEVVVKRNVNKMYDKYIKKWRPSHDYQKAYVIEFNEVATNSKSCNGTVSLMYDFRRKKMSEPMRLFYRCLDFKAQGDTTNIINNIAFAHYYYLNRFDLLDQYFRRTSQGVEGVDVSYGYLGIIDNYKAFTLNISTEGYNGQYIAYFDKVENTIKRIENNILGYDKNGKIISQNKIELEMGLIDGMFTITSFKDTSIDFKNNKKSETNASVTSVYDIERSLYRNFEKYFVEFERFIIN